MLMDYKTLSELIGIIYDTAFNIELWPRMVQMLSDGLTSVFTDTSDQEGRFQPLSLPLETSDLLFPTKESQGEIPKEQDPYGRPSPIRSPQITRAELLDLLHSHFIRAMAINRRIYEIQGEKNALLSLFDTLPLGMMIVDCDGYVLARNRRMDRILAEDMRITIDGKMLRIGSLADTGRLKQAIRTVGDSNLRQGETVHFSSLDSAGAMSAVVLPYEADTPIDCSDNHKAVVVITTAQMHIETSTEVLMSHYQLTDAEVKLVSSLVNGLSPNAIAENFGLSKHTVRNQLKSVYAKTGTHRQAELVKLLITGPALSATSCRREKNASPFKNLLATPVPPANSKSRLDQTMRLPDGRRLGYAEYGPKDGLPVMLMHASGSSRLERHPDSSIVEKAGVRLIVPDRPGGGLSDINPKQSLLDWAWDVSALADHLEIKKFSIIGNSLGGPFSLACARQLEKRIKRLVLVAGFGPVNNVKDLEGMYAPNRLMFFLARYEHILAETIMTFAIHKITMEAYQENQWRSLSTADKALIGDRTVKDRIKESHLENSRHSNYNTFMEVFLAACSWGFELSDINVPVELWQGEQDCIVPPHMARNMAAKLTNCRLRLIPDAGHYILFHCWKDILLSAINETF